MTAYRLQRQGLGAIPIIDAVIERLGLLPLLTEALGQARYAQAIVLLTKNVMLERQALYALRAWLDSYDPALMYAGDFNADVFARALDRLFATDRASVLTGVVLSAVKSFRIELKAIHQDTTSVTLSGAYARQAPTALQLKRGHSKDHRPDLKQLVYELSVTRDGAIPVHFKSHDGNRTDDTLHWDNWQALRGLLGRADFLYVADAKLCVSRTLLNIDRAQGRFITGVPRTRAEVETFRARVEACTVRWEKVTAKRPSRRPGHLDLYEVAAGLSQLREGFRLYWFRSSEKRRRDEAAREERITRAIDHLQALADPLRKKSPKTEAALRKRAQAIVQRFDASAWVRVAIVIEEVESFTQLTRGRASPDTVYRRRRRWVPRLNCSRNDAAIAASQAMDGVFPLATHTDLPPLEVLNAYKYQPTLEKRHALLKSGLQVAPIFLKKNDRIEALMFVYFLAQLLGALIERQLRRAMQERGLRDLQILPEERPSSRPTAPQVLRIFQACARHRLLTQTGEPMQTFSDPLTDLQHQILTLLSVPHDAYA